MLIKNTTDSTVSTSLKKNATITLTNTDNFFKKNQTFKCAFVFWFIIILSVIRIILYLKNYFKKQQKITVYRFGDKITNNFESEPELLQFRNF